MKNIMLDIETLGTEPGCVILSIGAVEFDDDSLGNSFEVNIDPESCTEAGLKIEPRTVMWWLEQDDAARKSLSNSNALPLDEALVGLTKAFDWQGAKVWCNGASFDFPILAAAYSAFNADTPWKYYDTMDFRTLKNLVSRKVYSECKSESEVKHNALADAIAQAETTVRLLQRLKVQ